MTEKSGLEPARFKQQYPTKAAESPFPTIMAQAQAAKEEHDALRLATLQERAENDVIKGDFDGSVTGYWKQIGTLGEGLVDYRGKTYVTKPIGFVSLPPGTEVELSFAQGTYYSKF